MPPEPVLLGNRISNRGSRKRIRRRNGLHPTQMAASGAPDRADLFVRTRGAVVSANSEEPAARPEPCGRRPEPATGEVSEKAPSSARSPIFIVIKSRVWFFRMPRSFYPQIGRARTAPRTAGHWLAAQPPPGSDPPLPGPHSQRTLSQRRDEGGDPGWYSSLPRRPHGRASQDGPGAATIRNGLRSSRESWRSSPSAHIPASRGAGRARGKDTRNCAA